MPQYTSLNPGYQMVIRAEIIDPVLSMPGRPYMKKPPLVVEFAEFGNSHLMLEGDAPVYASASNQSLPDAPYQTYDIQGGLIDTDRLIAKKRADKLWDDEDCDLVLFTLEDACTNPLSPFYGDIRRHEMPVPSAPWPTYDGLEPDQIPEFALNAGLVIPALVYEKATQERADVLAALEQAAARATELATLEAPAVA